LSSAGLNVNVETIDMAEKEVIFVATKVVFLPKEVVQDKEVETESRLVQRSSEYQTIGVLTN
jgi:hypothetical protein